MVVQWSAPVSLTAATAHAPTCRCSTLRALLGADARPVLFEVLGQCIDTHAVDARRAFVPAHLLQGTSQVLPVQDLGEQRAGRNRLGLEGKTRYFLA